MDFFDLNPDLTSEDLALKANANKFAREVMRPISKQLDRLPADRVTAPDSPLWVFLRKACAHGYHRLPFPETAGGLGLSPLQVSLVMEELAWGSLGLTVALHTSLYALAGLSESSERLRETAVVYCGGGDAKTIDSYAVTGADYDSDELVAERLGGRDSGVQSQCLARLDGNEYLISGRKAGWVSAGMMSGSVLLNASIDSTSGHAGSGIFLVPLDWPGVTRNEPQNKLGVRELSQGELYLDQVRVPRDSLVIGPDCYLGALEAHLALTSPLAGIWATGLARAAFDEALAYTRTRQRDANVPLPFSSVQQKLFDMFTKLEASRQLCRSAFLHNWSSPPKNRAVEYGVAAKVFAMQSCLEITGDAVQLLGSDGISKEYFVEKLFRDAQTSLACGGSRDGMTIAASHKVLRGYPRSREER